MRIKYFIYQLLISFSFSHIQFDYTGTIESWTVPISGTYAIDVYGAQGGSPTSPENASKGAKMSGNFYLQGGTEIEILVGQKGEASQSPGDEDCYCTFGTAGGGGGGSFVVLSDGTPLIIAGGGGGGLGTTNEHVGRIEETGGNTDNQIHNNENFDGGIDGNGGGYGMGGDNYGLGMGGGGFYTDGKQHWSGCAEAGKSFLNGGAGGSGGVCDSEFSDDYYGGAGGFGGGGAAWQSTRGSGGGGGGYSGGQGGTLVFNGGNEGSTNYGAPGGGGGSYNIGSNQDNEAGFNAGNGKIIINAIISDIDGNFYPVIEIGNQKWMGQNLRVTRFNNGDAINDVENLQNENWDSLTEPSMFRYENYDSSWESAEDIVGNLYNWYVVSDDRQVCPEGWHVPSDDEYKELEIYLGMSQLEVDASGSRGTNEGSKLSDYCTGHPINETCWPNTGSELTDDFLFGLTDFNLYPAGHIYNNQLNSPTVVAEQWTSSQRDANSTYTRRISTSTSKITRSGDPWSYGHSIRCIENIYGCMDEDACNYDDLANIDDGSCEYNSSIWYVSEDGNETCGNQEQPLSSIQDAIDLAQNGDTIYVSSGTYYENINFSSKNLALIGEDRLTTVIDGGNIDNVVLFLNSNHQDILLTNFTIQNGNPSGAYCSGGGIAIYGSSPKIINNFIHSNNSADIDNSCNGAGIYISCGSGGFNDCSPLIEDNIISNNYALGEAGGIMLSCSYNTEIYPTVKNNIIFDNHCNGPYSCGVRMDGSGIFLNNTVFGNTTGDFFGVCSDDPNQKVIVNNIFSHVADVNDDQQCIYDYNLYISGNLNGEGNITSDPLFVSEENNDFNLLPQSPCIDSGSPFSTSDPDGTRADMGALYYDQIENPLPEGCMDELACNYDENSVIDDGSCAEFDLCGECDGNNDTCDIIVDINGNQYGTVVIGNQTWMRQNLKAINYNNGDEIPYEPPGQYWDFPEERDGAYTIYDEDINNQDIYGNLYNYYAAIDERGLCPEGYMVPSDNDFKELEMYLGMSEDQLESWGCRITDNEGGKLKQEGYQYWNTPNTNATNSSGFTALPAGHVRNASGGINNWTYLIILEDWQTSPQYYYKSRLLTSYDGCVTVEQKEKSSGTSVRCLEIMEGCTDESACNYDLYANIDDGSCEFHTGNQWYVSPDGNDENCGSENYPLANIQSAIDAANPNDFINVSEGTYFEDLTIAKNVYIIGENSQSTIIDGSDSHAGIQIARSDQNSFASISNLTIQNGNGELSSGGGINIDAHQGTLLINLNNLIIKDNYASRGAGLKCDDGAEVNINNSVITNNHSNDYGGGIFANGCELNIDNTELSYNKVFLAYGGGIYSSSSDITINNSEIIYNENEGVGEGGGIYLVSDSYLDIQNSHISHNHARNFAGVCVYTTSSLSAYKVIFDGNTSDRNASAIGTVSANDVTLENCTFVNNHGVDNWGRPIYAETLINVKNCISYNNTYSANDGWELGDYFGNPGAFNISYSRSTENYYVSSYDLQTSINGNGNLFQDPQLGEYYNLESTSPCIDAGDPTSELDPDGTRADMGALPYYQPPQGCTDTSACNYDENAEIDDGSCAVFDLCGECDGDNDSCEIVTDINGNQYGTVVIGNQTWMRQNLKVTNYKDGNAICDNIDQCHADNWPEATQGLYTNYVDNTYTDEEQNVEEHGRLYNWHAVDDQRGICPEQWLVPSEEDMQEFKDYLWNEYETALVADMIKDFDWNSNPGNNETGYSLKPSGYYSGNAGGYYYSGMGQYTKLWTSTSTNNDPNNGNAVFFRVWYGTDEIYLNDNGDTKQYGYSVRCLQADLGCTDELACNYDPDANYDDGSCIYNMGAWYVSQEEGSDGNCGSQDQPLSSIQEAINRSMDGDVIYISEGIYDTGELSIENNKNIDLVGDINLGTILRPERITINSSEEKFINLSNLKIESAPPYNTGQRKMFIGCNECVNSDAKINVTIDNVEFDGNNQISAVALTTNYNVTINNSSFNNLEAGGADGGAFHITNDANDGYDHKTLNINNSTFDYCKGNTGGAIYSETEPSVINIDNSNFLNNYTDIQNGGAIRLINGTIIIDNSDFSNNITHSQGGAIAIEDQTNAIVTNTTFVDNNSSDSGGAILVRDNAYINIDNCEFIGNISSYNGGAIKFNNSNFDITNSTFISNDAGQNNNPGYGGAILCNISIGNISNSTFTNNGAHLGAGIYFDGASTTYLSENIFDGNTADWSGGAIANSGTNQSAIDFNKNQFINNISLGSNGGGHGGAIYSGGNGSLYFTNCNFTQNTALNGGAIHCNNNHSTDVVNSIFWSNSEPVVALDDQVYFNVSYSVFEGDIDNISLMDNFSGQLNWLDGNKDEDPQFNEDYSLQPSSPCIDAGDPASEPDPDGTRADIGAIYYYQEPVPGCTNPYANNFDADATLDDDSCEFEEDNIMWFNNEYIGGDINEINYTQYNLDNDLWIENSPYTIGTGSNYPIRTAYDPINHKMYVVQAINISPGFKVYIYDIFSDTWMEGSSFIPDHNGGYFEAYDIVYDVENEALALSTWSNDGIQGHYIFTYTSVDDTWSSITSCQSGEDSSYGGTLIYNTKTKKTVLGTYYGDNPNWGLQLFEIDIDIQTCRNIYQGTPFGTPSIASDNFLYDTEQDRYLYLYNNGTTINVGAIENDNGFLYYNSITSTTVDWMNLNQGTLPSAYMHKDNELVFSWIYEQDNGTEWQDYYNKIFTYNFNNDIWTNSDLIYVSNHQFSIPNKNDMEYFPDTYENLLYFDNLEGVDNNYTVDVWLSSISNVAGFQFDVTNVNINNISGGLEDQGWEIDFNESGTIIGFNVSGDVLPPGQHLITTLEFNNTNIEVCLDELSFANEDSNSIEISAGDCLDVAPIQGCVDVLACNYNSDANVNDGSCIYPEGCDTCSGETDGTGTIVDNDADNDSVCDDEDVCEGFDDLSDSDNDGIPDDCDDCEGLVDDCGVCDGNNIDIDCNGECFGNAVEDCFGICEGEAVLDCNGVCDGEAINDDCGECDGQNFFDDDGLLPDGSCDCEGQIFDLCMECGGTNECIPKLTSTTNPDNILSIYNPVVELSFSTEMDENSLSNILLSSAQNEVYDYNITYQNQIAQILIEQPISYDSITLKVPTSDLLSSDGYPMDLDGTEDIYFVYNMQTLADYNNDLVIDVEDMNQFILGWKDNNQNFELGPFEGVPPYLMPTFDNEFTLQDIVAFTYMWDWSSNNTVLQSIISDNVGFTPDIYLEDHIIRLDLSSIDQVMSIKTHLTASENMEVDYIDNSNLFDMSFTKSNENIYQIDLGRFDVDFKLELLGLYSLKSNFNEDILLDYEIYDYEGILINSGSVDLEYQSIPDEYALYNNYPNPFNPTTNIIFDVPSSDFINITIYDLNGKMIKNLYNGNINAGSHKIVWDAKDNSSGIYIVKLISDHFVGTQKIMLIK